jgi:hypothetical protein
MLPQETVNRANKLANDIGKRLMTDRLIACMLLTLLFLIFIIIVMKSFGYGTETIDGQVTVETVQSPKILWTFM